MSDVTVVTGGSRGIGAATAQRLAADGHAVVICYRSDEAGAATVAERITEREAGVWRYAPTRRWRPMWSGCSGSRPKPSVR